MKQYIGFCALLILLSSYSSSGNTAEKNYITRDIQVDFSVNKEKVSDELQQQIIELFIIRKTRVYYGFTPKSVTRYTSSKTTTYEIKQNQVAIEEVVYTINKEGGGAGLRLVSEAGQTCGFIDCVITMKLQPVDDGTPALQKIKARFAAEEKFWQERMAQERAELAAIPLNDFPGVVVSLTKDFTIKLPLSSYKTLKSQSGIYWQRMGNQEVYFNIKDENTRAYQFNQFEASAPSGGKRIVISGELFVVKTAKNDAYLERWLASQKGIHLSTPNGAIYYNETYLPEAVYFQYDDAAGCYVIARASAQDYKLTTAARAFAIIRTLDPKYRGQDEISLSGSELEARYQGKTEQMFKLPQVQQELGQSVKPP